MKSESEIQQEIRLESPKLGVTLLRNNQGGFKDETGRLVRFGLGNESPNQFFLSSDLIGFTEIVIGPDMIGKRVAVFTSIEVKKEKDTTKKERKQKQQNWIEFVKDRGGIAAFCNSVDELRKIILG